MSDFDYEIQQKSRFEFGKNWKSFARGINSAKIDAASNSLQRLLGTPSLAGLRLLDAGSGSGLSSLAARKLGAEVVSVDFDRQSVECTQLLRKTLRIESERQADQWKVLEGSVLDGRFLKKLGKFDIVYSWGVVHHTGAMFTAIEKLANNVRPGGQLVLAVYNHQQFASPYWKFVKKTYVSVPATRPLLIGMHLLYPSLPSLALRFVQGRKPERGMSFFTDLKDWLGGFPFEVAKPEEVLEFCRSLGFELVRLKTVGSRSGCNEFVFTRLSDSSS